MSTDHRHHAPSPESVEIRARLLREMSANPGPPDLASLTSYVKLVHIRLFGVAHDRDHDLGDRVAAVVQLGREALAAGAKDPRGVRDEVRQLLDALHGMESAEPDEGSPRMLGAIEQALEHCASPRQ